MSEHQYPGETENVEESFLEKGLFNKVSPIFAERRNCLELLNLSFDEIRGMEEVYYVS